MKQAKYIFNDDERALIARTISSAESATDGEIVVVVANTSGRYDRAEDIFGLLISLGFTALYWFFAPSLIEVGWGSDNAAGLPFWPLMLIIPVGFISGAWLASVIPALTLLFISKREMQEEVERRALEVFQKQRIRTTTDGTGVLIYISLFEHMVRVVGDDAINEKVTPQTWQEITQHIVKGMKENNPAEGLIKAIQESGVILQKHFPSTGDQNQLKNDLILLN